MESLYTVGDPIYPRRVAAPKTADAARCSFVCVCICNNTVKMQIVLCFLSELERWLLEVEFVAFEQPLLLFYPYLCWARQPCQLSTDGLDRRRLCWNQTRLSVTDNFRQLLMSTTCCPTCPPVFFGATLAMLHLLSNQEARTRKLCVD